MLKINKISTKKIKLPLSLRGAKKKSNLSGFSLIELMIAITILALAVFGIFQAYSVGFMGIADSRDRTVATNYLQEMIEDFKNMDFNQVKSEPITPLPDTKFSRGAYVLNLEVIDEVITLKKVIAQVRWIDRKGNIKTEKASTIIYNKPATSEVGDNATEIVLYADSYYTILPNYTINLIAEIKDENGNIYDWNGPITFSIITVRIDGIPLQVGDIATEQPVYATNGVANCIFTAYEGTDIEGIERIQASATVDGNILTDTVNIRVTTGPVGIILEPATEEDGKRPADENSTINIKVVRADYDPDNSIEYSGDITLTAIGPGTLSTTTISLVPTEGTSFTLASDGTPGIVEITAFALDLDIGYTEIIFTGEPTSILITPEKKSIYPGENIGIKVTIVDVNNVPVSFNEDVDLSALPNYGNFNDDSLSFTGQSSLDITVFTAYSYAPVDETITIQANAGALSGSTNIIILSLLTPYYLDLFAHPLSVDIYADGEEIFTSITATIYDDSGTEEIVTTYKTPITFVAKDKDGNDFNGSFSEYYVIPNEGEVTVEFSSVDNNTGTAKITASSGDLILIPAGGIDVVFYGSATQIVLSAVPSSIEAGGNQTSIITATVCDTDGNRVTNYNKNGDKSIIFTTTIGGFPDNENQNTIISSIFDEGQVTVALSSTVIGTAEVTASSIDDPSVDNGSISIEITGDVSTVLTLGEVTNQDDYLITFDINVTESSFILEEIKVEWDNSSAPLDLIVIKSPSTEEGLTIPTEVSDSPSTLTEIGKTLFKDVTSNIGLSFTNGVSKMEQKNITVTFTEDDGTPHVVLFIVPNM